uniref:Uncharacterized protein n=1 Tax=Salvator merianae TaxID=96440 RepID=A0A8D0C0W3_SALMN
GFQSKPHLCLTTLWSQIVGFSGFVLDIFSEVLYRLFTAWLTTKSFVTHFDQGTNNLSRLSSLHAQKLRMNPITLRFLATIPVLKTSALQAIRKEMENKSASVIVSLYKFMGRPYLEYCVQFR